MLVVLTMPAPGFGGMLNKQIMKKLIFLFFSSRGDCCRKSCKYYSGTRTRSPIGKAFFKLNNHITVIINSKDSAFRKITEIFFAELSAKTGINCKIAPVGISTDRFITVDLSPGLIERRSISSIFLIQE